MYACVQSMTLNGLRGDLVRVEVDVANGLPAFDLVGLPAATVREARERVRTAIKNGGFDFPLQRITVNLSPADLKKEGSGLDLPIALGILAATAALPAAALAGHIFLGELSLDGQIRPIPGVLPMAAALFQEHPGAVLVVPLANLREASLVEGLTVHGGESLRQVVESLGAGEWPSLPPAGDGASPPPLPVDLAEVRGQGAAKRALEIAAAGGHNIMLLGPPGTGKTLLARSFPSILPPMSRQEQLAATAIFSAAGMLPEGEHLIRQRPFRSPHHSASVQSLIGGGRVPKPGEITLASHGVLFLDELPEFRRDVLEALRQPLEDRQVTITRLHGAVTYPVLAQVIATGNLCPCGRLGLGQDHDCRCSPAAVQRYRSRISGPLMDRLDLHIEVPKITYEELHGSTSEEEPSALVRERVMAARSLQERRFGCTRTNAQMTPKEINVHCPLDQKSQELLRLAFQRLGLSPRGHQRILKVARTIADLAGSEAIASQHVAEALQYRGLEGRWLGAG